MDSGMSREKRISTPVTATRLVSVNLSLSASSTSTKLTLLVMKKIVYSSRSYTIQQALTKKRKYYYGYSSSFHFLFLLSNCVNFGLAERVKRKVSRVYNKRDKKWCRSLHVSHDATMYLNDCVFKLHILLARVCEARALTFQRRIAHILIVKSLLGTNTKEKTWHEKGCLFHGRVFKP